VEVSQKKIILDQESDKPLPKKTVDFLLFRDIPFPKFLLKFTYNILIIIRLIDRYTYNLLDKDKSMAYLACLGHKLLLNCKFRKIALLSQKWTLCVV